jgi:dTDP-4-dehydrorhamnose 3,5-epimerase
MWPMKFTPLSLPGLILIEPDVHKDERGYFLETYHHRKYREGGLDAAFVQDNRSRSVRGILRGLHAQRKRPQGKLICAVEGEIFDVAVDIRPGSATFGRWEGVALSADNFRQLYVPPGFAHGFLVRTPTAVVEYKCTELYDPADEIVLLWNDPDVGVEWPAADPVLSPKDAKGKTLKELSVLLSA